METKLSAATQKNVEELCAAVVKLAYTDLLDARMFDAQVRYRNYSYNCNKRYEEFRTKRRYKTSTTEKNTMKQLHEQSMLDIVRLEKWFLRSERFKMFSQGADGEWFVKKAKKQVQKFIDDKIMEYDVYPRYVGKGGLSEDGYAKKKAMWEKAMREWRKEHELEEVETE